MLIRIVASLVVAVVLFGPVPVPHVRQANDPPPTILPTIVPPATPTNGPLPTDGPPPIKQTAGPIGGKYRIYLPLLG